MPHRARWLLLAAALLPALASAQAISITGGAPAVQDFGSLAASGTGTTLPAGWYSAETGSNANAIYTAGTGASNSGDTYSWAKKTKVTCGGCGWRRQATVRTAS